MHGETARRISAYAEKRRMADRDLTRIAEHHVESEHDDGEDGDRDEEMKIIGTRDYEGADCKSGESENGEKRLR